VQNHVTELKSQPSNATPAGERKIWNKPALEEFGIAAATRNAGIINLDADHALDIS
jgi:hypothetical protein